MPHVGSEIDANFYQLIHTMLEAPRKEPAEQRSRERHAYRIVQRIALWDGAGFPRDDEFTSIVCHDLTRSGFSFLSATEPPNSLLVVEFGVRPQVLYLAAQILHFTPVIRQASGVLTRIDVGGRTEPSVAQDDEGGQRMFLVGCRFTRRLRSPR